METVEKKGKRGVIKTILAAGLLVVGTAMMGAPETRSSQAESNPVSPERVILSEPIRLEVKIEPEFAAHGGIKFVCETNTYCGECSSREGDSSLKMAVSGTIQRINGERFLISYDLEVRLGDSSGLASFSAAGSGLLRNGKPTRIVTMAGRSVVMTATLGTRKAESTN